MNGESETWTSLVKLNPVLAPKGHGTSQFPYSAVEDKEKSMMTRSKVVFGFRSADLLR